jgi:hypothetical protein
MVLPLALGTFSYVFYHRKLRAKKEPIDFGAPAIGARAVA